MAARLVVMRSMLPVVAMFNGIISSRKGGGRVEFREEAWLPLRIAACDAINWWPVLPRPVHRVFLGEHFAMCADLTTPADARYRRAVEVLFDFSRGSLWRVREDLWRSLLAGYESKRRWHPGLSVRGDFKSHTGEVVPMLHGTSGAHGPVVVRGCTEERDASHPTSFGHLVHPAAIPVAVIVAPRKGRTAKRDKMEGYWWEAGAVSPNHHKPRLNAQERAALEQFILRLDERDLA